MCTSLDDDTKSINVSKHLHELLKQKSRENNFKTIDDYVEHVLLQILHAEAPDEIDPKEEEQIKQRLERLGYL